MEPMISFCGLLCNECPAYIAKQEDNDELRKRTAEQWSKQFKMDMKPEDINCDGCVAEGVHSGYCRVCEIRKCGMKKELESCAMCDAYACDKVTMIHQHDHKCKERLDALRKKQGL